ncbi:hypothetical protein QOL99_04560 [Deinococcus sp. MIMF12]|uniref:Uncharacterized protein n=1 Tax=Deinococcus rhizophilus TaxID=3049544 RepID=A0ABT7JEQ5_9DEIO|nr:hypothetical protein [Deinococcus rhizophilus]MDL2343421.1 hypothetical protein [Deinococcus rhizophilus]
MTRLLLHHPASSILLTGLGERFHPGLLPVVPNVQAGRDVRGSLRGAGRALTLTQWAREALQESGWRPLRPGEREAFFRDAVSSLALVQDTARRLEALEFARPPPHPPAASVPFAACATRPSRRRDDRTDE